jgi:hypothetical protein
MELETDFFADSTERGELFVAHHKVARLGACVPGSRYKECDMRVRTEHLIPKGEIEIGHHH